MTQPQTERLGVSALDYFFSEKGWLFREQTTHDYGIDAHIEIVENQRPTGKLIALQIKSGQSFFKEEVGCSYVFRTNDKHIDYWVSHSMPVVLVLYNPTTKQAYLQHVSRETVVTTGKGWKILVPSISIFDEPIRHLNALDALAQPEPYIRRLNRLRIDRHWMDLIEQGYEVRVQFDDWVNKSLPRYKVTISTDYEEKSWPTLYAPGRGIEGMLNHYFPWADFSLDMEAYEQGAIDNWESECYSWRDSETSEVFYSMPFDEWYEPPTQNIVPVSMNGETASYSLLLTLNEFGKCFLMIDKYFADPSAPETIGFTLE